MVVLLCSTSWREKHKVERREQWIIEKCLHLGTSLNANPGSPSIIKKWLFVLPKEEKFLILRKGTARKSSLQEKNIAKQYHYNISLLDPSDVLLLALFMKGQILFMMLIFLKTLQEMHLFHLEISTTWNPRPTLSGQPREELMFSHGHFSWFLVSVKCLPTLRHRPSPTTPPVSLLITSPFKQLLFLFFTERCVFMAHGYIIHFIESQQPWWEFYHTPNNIKYISLFYFA